MVVYIMDEKEKQKLEKLNARYKKQNEAIKEKYDRVSVTLPKGTKERIQARGETVNGYINRLILADLERLERLTGSDQPENVPRQQKQTTEDPEDLPPFMD